LCPEKKKRGINKKQKTGQKGLNIIKKGHKKQKKVGQNVPKEKKVKKYNIRSKC
jgi:hypothetical protein